MCSAGLARLERCVVLNGLWYARRGVVHSTGCISAAGGGGVLCGSCSWHVWSATGTVPALRARLTVIGRWRSIIIAVSFERTIVAWIGSDRAAIGQRSGTAHRTAVNARHTTAVKLSYRKSLLTLVTSLQCHNHFPEVNRNHIRTILGRRWLGVVAQSAALVPSNDSRGVRLSAASSFLQRFLKMTGVSFLHRMIPPAGHTFRSRRDVIERPLCRTRMVGSTHKHECFMHEEVVNAILQYNFCCTIFLSIRYEILLFFDDISVQATSSVAPRNLSGR